MYTVSYKLYEQDPNWKAIPCSKEDIAKFTAMELLEDGYIVRIEQDEE